MFDIKILASGLNRKTLIPSSCSHRVCHKRMSCLYYSFSLPFLLKEKSCLHTKINLAEKNCTDLHKKWSNNEGWEQPPSIRKLKQSMNFYCHRFYYHLTKGLERFGFWDQDRVWPHSRDDTLRKPRCKISFNWKSSQRTPGKNSPVTLGNLCNLYFHEYLKNCLDSLRRSNPTGQIWLSFAQEKNLGYSSDANQQTPEWCLWWGTGCFPCNPSKHTSEL